MIKTTNLTYKELYKLAKQKETGRIFQIIVQHDPFGNGEEQVLNAYIDLDRDICGGKTALVNLLLSLV